MGFDKDYPNRKDHRKPYYGAAAVDHTCRPGGSCPACRDGRVTYLKRLVDEYNNKLKEYNEQ